MNVKALERDERIEVVSDLIRTSKTPVKADDICELTGRSMSCVMETMRLAKLRHPEITGIHGVGYMWKEQKEQKEKPDRYNDFKNDEGYNDPTAALAMRMMEPKEVKIDVGDMWSVSSDAPSYGNGSWLILSTYDGKWANCLEVYDPNKYAASNSTHISFFEDDSKTLYVDCRRVTTKSMRYFDEYKGKVSGDMLAFIKQKVAEAIEIPGYMPAPVTPVAYELDIKEGPAISDLDFELVKQEAQIYKSVFYALVNGRGVGA